MRGRENTGFSDQNGFSCDKRNHLKEQARKLQATLVRNYHSLARLLTGVKCRATSVAKKQEIEQGMISARGRETHTYFGIEHCIVPCQVEPLGTLNIKK